MLLGILLLLVIPFILPIVSLVSLAGVRRRLRDLEDMLERQQGALDELTKRVRDVRKSAAAETTYTAAAEPAKPEPPAVPVAPPQPPPTVAPPLQPPPVVVPPYQPPPVVVPPPAPPISSAADVAPTPVTTQTPVSTPAPPPRMPAAPRVGPPPPPRTAHGSIVKPPPPPPPPAQPFDWERLIGVKMFSAIAGVALTLAAVFFLRYSIDQGWLGPPIRVAIGVLTGIALLVVCDLKAARRYPATANAMDAAAIAILFSTFYAANALWHLIPAAVAFGLLALVTAVAVLLSIRRDSMFIAVLGLLGGFATPALLSTGENRPVPLFAYLLLLNIGLAWVAHKKRWSALTILTLVFTAIYQWGWVIKFLTASQLSLAMGIFLLFALTGFSSLMFGARASAGEPEEQTLEKVGLGAAVMPLLFAAFLAAVPKYGAQPDLLFGFLLIIDVGLVAMTIARRDELAHAIGAGATVLVFAVWLAMSYASGAWTTATAFAVAFVALFALAPVVAGWFSRPLTGLAEQAEYAAPILLFVFPVIARIEPAVEAPLKLFAPLFALLALIAWRAMASEEFPLYFIAAFFGVAAEASWSVTHLTPEHLTAAVVLYAAFGVFYIGVPLIARRTGREIAPAWGGGAVLIASLLLLLFLASGTRPAASLWGLAVLLAILDAGIFVESASGGLPPVSIIGGALSWVVLAVWWQEAAAVVGLLPSLLFLVGLTLMMLVGHAWAHRRTAGTSSDIEGVGFRHGTYLGLVGHLFLFFVAVDPAWSTPPWPLFGALTVLTLALSASSLAVRMTALHVAGVVAASVIVFGWAQVSGVAWTPTMLVAGESVAAYALIWAALARIRGLSIGAAAGAVVTLFVAELTLIDASAMGSSLPLAAITVTHAVNLALVLAIAWIYRWPWVAPAAVLPAAVAAFFWRSTQHPEPAAWASLLTLASALYVVFAAYPFVLGRRARESRDPFLTAIGGSAFFFFAARAALRQGALLQYAGAVPIFEAAVMALLLRQLLRLQPVGERDLGRLALVAATALAFVTVAIPLQLSHQWITIGWALEGAALAWTYRRIPHRGLLSWGFALLAAVFARLALNPAIFVYEPRGPRLFNWYLYAYLICASAMFLAAWSYSKTEDRLVESLPRASAMLPAAGVILLFLLLNIEIADYYATGPAITFRFGVTLAQDLTYTIGWLIFGLLLLTATIYLHNRPGRIAAVAVIAVTAFKAFLYDMGSLGGLYRVVSLVGLAISLALVALALQKFVLRDFREQR